MNCPQCGNEMKPDSKFCNKCGSAAESVNLACLNCGKPIAQGNKFCTGCGFVVGSAPVNSEKNLGKKKKAGIIVSLCAVTVGIAVVTVFMITSKNEPEGSHDLEPPPSASSIIPLAPTVQPQPTAESATPDTSDSDDDASEDSAVIDIEIEQNLTTELMIEPQFDKINGGFDEFGRARVKQGDSWHLIDINGNHITSTGYTQINFFNHGLATVERDKKYGYIDIDGNEIISPRFDEAFNFSDYGIARVKQDGKSGYIDTNGDMLIEPQYTNGREFSEGYAAVYNGSYWFFIDEINNYMGGNFENALKFSDGLAAVKQGGKWGYIDTSFIMVITPQFDAPERKSDGTAEYPERLNFVDGLALVQIENKQYFIDITGNRFSESGDEVYTFQNGYATAFNDSKYGYISKSTGEYIIPAEYSDAWSFNDNGLCAVSEREGSWYYIDTNNAPQFNGKQWQEAYNFNESVAKVKEYGLYGFIDVNGNEITAAEWDDALYSINGSIAVCKDGKWGFLEVIPAE